MIEDGRRNPYMEGGAMRAMSALIMLVALFVNGLRAEVWGWRRISWEEQLLRSVVCPPDSENVIYVSVPYVISEPDSGPGVYKSTDSGQTWRFLSESESDVCYSLTANPLDHNTIYCGTRTIFTHPDGWPWRSRDAGEHWDRSFDRFARYVASPWNENIIFGIDASQIYDIGYQLSRSGDNGTTWIEICEGSESDAFISDNVVFHREDSLTVFAPVVFETPDSVGLGRSQDEGITWDIVLPGKDIPGFDQDPFVPSHWVALQVISPGTGAEQVWFAESFDDGETWEERLLDLDFSVLGVRRLMIDKFDPQVLYLLAPGLVPGLYRSTDGGDTWSAMDEGFSPSTGTKDIILLKDRPGEILAARSDGLWKWTDQQEGENHGVSISEIIRIESVSPCPFREITHVGMNIPKSGMVTAQVYSLRGGLERNLFSKSFKRGIHQFVWDGRDDARREVSPGVYVLIVGTGDTSVSQRIVKLK